MWVEGWGDLPGQLVVVSGPSGCGKSSVIRRALANPGLNVELSVSATTRDPRPGEIEAVDYRFMSFEGFEEVRDLNGFLEWAEYNHNLYGTPAEPVYQSLRSGKSVLLEIEVNGALQIRAHAPSSLFVFIRTPTFKDLEGRLRNRGTEKETNVFRRLRRAREELAHAHWYDVQLVNDDLDRCVNEFTTVLQSYGAGG